MNPRPVGHVNLSRSQCWTPRMVDCRKRSLSRSRCTGRWRYAVTPFSAATHPSHVTLQGTPPRHDMQTDRLSLRQGTTSFHLGRPR